MSSREYIHNISWHLSHRKVQIKNCEILSVKFVFIILGKSVIKKDWSLHFDNYILVHRQEDLNVGSNSGKNLILESIYIIIK